MSIYLQEFHLVNQETISCADHALLFTYSPVKIGKMPLSVFMKPGTWTPEHIFESED